MDIGVQDERVVDTTPVNLDRLLALANHVAVEQSIPEDMEMVVTLVDEPPMAELNAEHMGKSGPTDVLSFPIDSPYGSALEGDPPRILGDVIVCPLVAQRQAPSENRTTTQEIDLLVVHGMLHLLGHDHADTAERDAMFALTDQLLASFNATEGAHT